MNRIPDINLQNFTYDLPQQFIADKPAGRREDSKLLEYNKGRISHHTFNDIASLIPANATLFLNDTKVIPARLNFQRKSGANIEIFLLEPTSAGGEMEQIMHSTRSCTWKCMIGNLKKWKPLEKLELTTASTIICAELIDRETKEVTFTWSGQIPFSTVLVEIGKIPLPPYIKRDVDVDDKDRYQTVYANYEGAVAAPTAGLHFTPGILDRLDRKNIVDYLTLHVGAGTFEPISVDRIGDHPMHGESMSVSSINIKRLKGSNYTVAVGTTSVRTLESLYWFGVKLENEPDAGFFIEKDFPYRDHERLSVQQAADNIESYMRKNNLEVLKGSTEILIVPGYTFQVVKALITNFHLPGSTLILLIAAFIGADWEKVYTEAKNNQYRFLSYGDSSLLIA